MNKTKQNSVQTLQVKNVIFLLSFLLGSVSLQGDIYNKMGHFSSFTSICSRYPLKADK